MQESIITANKRINEWAKQAIELHQEYEFACNMASRYCRYFNADGNDTDRKAAIRYLGGAWKKLSKLIVLKQNIACEASMLAKIYQIKAESPEAATLDEAYSLKADSEYFETMKQRVARERDEYVTAKRRTFNSIKTLRLKKAATTNA